MKRGEKLKIGIIGCGMISDTHVKQIKEIKGAEIVGVCDKELMMAEQLAERYEIPYFYSDMKKMIKERAPDIVHILTPPTAHKKVCTLAIEAGCHVFVEKPFTRNYEEALTVVEKAIEMGKKVAVNHFHNYSPPALRINQLISNGDIGEIVHLESFYSYSMESAAAKTLLGERQSWLHSLPGMILQNNISHLLYKLIDYMPNGVLKAHAIGYSYRNGNTPGNVKRIDDELRVILTDGKISAYATFSANISPFGHYLMICGTRKTIIVDYESRAVVCWPNSHLPGPFGKLASPLLLSKNYFTESIYNIGKFVKSDFQFYAGMNRLLQLFYDSVQNDTAPPISYQDILRLTLLIDDIFAQIYGNS